MALITTNYSELFSPSRRLPTPKVSKDICFKIGSCTGDDAQLIDIVLRDRVQLDSFILAALIRKCSTAAGSVLLSLIPDKMLDPYALNAHIERLIKANQIQEALRVARKYTRVANHQTFMHLMVPSIAKEAMALARQLGKYDPATLNKYLTCMKTKQDFEGALAVADELTGRLMGQQDPHGNRQYFVNMLLDLAANHLPAATRTMEQATALGLVDATTYATYIQAAGKAKCFPQAQSAFEECQRAGCLNSVVINNYIVAMQDCEEYAHTHDAYRIAKKSGLLSPKILTSLIGCAGKTRTPWQIDRYYREALEGGCDAWVFAAATAAFNGCDRFERARDVYDAGRSLGMHNEVSINAFIVAASQAKRLDLAKEAYREAPVKSPKMTASIILACRDHNDCASAGRYYDGSSEATSAYMQVLGATSGFEAARQLFESHKKTNETYYHIIIQSFEAGKDDLARQLLDAAKNDGLIDDVTYQTYLKRADFKEALQVFNTIPEDERTSSMYSCMIERAEDRIVAKHLYRRAQVNYKVDDGVIKSLFSAFARLHSYDDLDAFIGQNRHTDACIGIYIDWCVSRGEFQKARALFKTHLRLSFSPDEHYLDVHGLSYGGALIAVSLCMGSGSLVVITGRGGPTHGHRQAMRTYITENISRIRPDLSATSDPLQEGRLFISSNDSPPKRRHI
jgi:tetratricopeptide (TPR) repeat protein